ncbi:MAG: helix-turn-helix domain-containing protein [Clostridia bacterium]|nr:helix-turn-helix domain-containing protein [Clostridia bacterium]
MRKIVEWNQERGSTIRWTELTHVEAYRNVRGGWVDYLLSDRLVFAHRITEFVNSQSAGVHFTGKLHLHRYFELVICVGGEGMQYIANRCHVTVGRGAAIVTAPNVMHLYRPQQPTRYDRYVLLFVPDLLMTAFPDSRVMDFLQRVGQGEDLSSLCLQISGEQMHRLLQLAAQAERQLQEDTPYSASQAWLTLSELFLMLSMAAEQAESQRALPAEAPEFICTIKQYIDEEYINIRSVSDLAERFFYSREYITRVFRKYYNTPLYEYIIRRKLLHNCALLGEGISVEEAAALSGFHNMSSYIKQFRQFTGLTPSAYRAQLKKGGSFRL